MIGMASSQGDVRSSPIDGIPSGAAAAKTPATPTYGQTRALQYLLVRVRACSARTINRQEGERLRAPPESRHEKIPIKDI
jgi:hypothetical protein